jgi:hypothetical protein
MPYMPALGTTLLPEAARPSPAHLLSIDPRRPIMVRRPNHIFDSPPRGWRQLQAFVAQVFAEIGCRVAIEKTLELARGTATVDVVVRDTTTVPNSLYVCECKYWTRRVTKHEIHAFRTVVTEVGANRGFLISRRGFQDGAMKASEFSNLDLLTWEQFESLMSGRWLAGVSRALSPDFARAMALMNPNEESLWKDVEFSVRAYDEWTAIARRYPLVTVWHLLHAMSTAGIRAIPSFQFPLAPAIAGRRGVRLDSLRKIVDYAPIVCQSAVRELEAFWSRQPRRRKPQSR